MKPPQSHKPFLILAFAITLLVGALYCYMYWQVNVSLGKAVVARELARTEEDNKSREKDLIKLYQSTAAERAQLGSFFIPSDKTVQFIEAVESIGPQSGAELDLSDIAADPLEKAAPGTRGNVHAHVEAHGSWAAVYRVLLFAERLPYKLIVSDVRMETSGLADKGPREWRISFDINAILIVTPAPPAPATP
ncbi:MAG: hypothetical protein V4481_05375 [Patescibacteria group bacterium]